jgi:NADPH:quinone reductase-like Zn-dependent oxidoreductase
LRIPKNLAPEEAVGMITVFTTVLYALEYRTKVREGDSILIHSACGGVGIAAIQMRFVVAL